MSCPNCFSGSLDGRTPAGTVSTIHGVPTYVAKPEGTPTALVVIISDAFGWDTPNIRVLADTYSKGGNLLVYVPDFMRGSSCSPSAMLLLEKITTPASWFETIVWKPWYALQAASMAIPWIIQNRPSAAKPYVFDFFRALRADPSTSSQKIGAAGFCWGGKFTVLLCQDTPSSRIVNPNTQQLGKLVDCGFTAHPSLLSVPGDIEAVTVPLSIAIGDADMALSKELTLQSKDILEKKDKEHEVVIIPGAKHGFAIRGVLTEPETKKHADVAEEQALAWFAKYLS